MKEMEHMFIDDGQGNPGHPRVTGPSVIVPTTGPPLAALLLTPKRPW
jgi:hypothetical protein